MDQTLTTTDTSIQNYPLLADRVQSTFIDTILVVGSMFPIAALLENMGNPPDWIRIALFFILFAIYEPVCTCLGCTVGNYLKGIRVRQAGDTGKRINLAQALVRYIVKVLLGWISFITIHSNPQRRAIHDHVAGSVMINARTNSLKPVK